MPVSIPDFPSVGFDDPRAAGGLPNFPANDAGAQGMEVLGKGIEKGGQALADMGAMQEYRRQRLNEANATTALVSQIIPLHAAIAKETDRQKLTDLKAQYSTILQSAAQGITDPLRQKMWIANHSEMILRGNAEADSHATDLYRHQATANALTNMDNAVRAGVASPDPSALANTQAAINNNLDWMGQYAGTNPEHVRTYKNAYQKQLIEGRALYLTENGDPAATSAFLDQHRGDIDSVLLGNLKLRIDSRGRKINTDGAALRALGLPTIGVGGLPAGTPSVGGAPSPGGHINYGGTGALGNPNDPGWAEKNLTTIQSPSGAPFKVNKAAAADFTGFLKDLEAAGYKPDPEQSGGHALRNMRGGHSLSEHAYGSAIDINWNSNAYSKEGKLSTDLPQNISELAAKHNLEWGGNWHDPVDAMHFQWRGPGGQGAVADNNLGGIRRPGAPASKAEGGFETYATPEGGVQAIADKLQKYSEGGVTTATNPTGAPLNTIRGIVSTWAPPNENDTPALIARAAQVTGFDPDQVLDVSNPDVKAKLIEATIRNEQGGRMPIDPAVIAKVAGTSAQPIPTGETAPSQPAAGAQPAPPPPQNRTGLQPAPPPPQNRTGLPSLEEVYQKLVRDPTMKTDRDVLEAFATATARYNAMEADAARAERIQTQANAQHVADAENEAWKDIYSANPKITAQQVAVDPRYNSNPMRREQIIKLINDPPGSGVPAHQSYAAALSLVQRIRLPEGDPNKITDSGQIYDAMSKLNRPDFEYVQKQFNDIRTPGGETLKALRGDFIKRYGAFINKSNPIAGSIDAVGQAREFELERFIDGKIDDYRKAGKNPADLFQPKNSDFVGSPEILKMFQPTAEESMRSLSDWASGVVSPLTPVGKSPPASSPATRAPGETPEQYIKRIGG